MRSAVDLLVLSNMRLDGYGPTRSEMIALDRFSNAEIKNLLTLPEITSWDILIRFATLARTNADLIALCGLQVANRRPRLVQLRRLESVPTLKITTLQQANLPQANNWDELIQLCLLRQSAADIIARTQIQVGGTVPALRHLLAVDSYSNNELQAVFSLRQADTWDEFAIVMRGIQKVMAAMIKSMSEELEKDLPEIGNALSLTPSFACYAALLVDIDSAQAFANDQDVNRFIIADYIQQYHYNACFDGADRLVQLLGNEHANVSYTSGGGPRDEYPQPMQLTRAQLLCDHLQQAAASEVPTLFRVHLGGHGFTFTVEHHLVCKLETLAGAGDQGTLARSIQLGYSRDLAQVQQDLVRITGNDVSGRIDSAKSFNWTAGPIAILQKSAPDREFDQIKDPMAIYWTASPLRDREQVVTRFAAKIKANRDAIVAKIGADL